MNIEMPKSWVTARLDDVADIRLGKMLDKGRPKGTPYKYLRNLNVRWDSIDTSDLFSMSFENHELERFGIRDGDLLVCEGGEPGRAAVWNHGATDLKYQKALHRIRLPGPIAARWVMYQLMLDAASGRLSPSLTGSTIAHLPREKLAEYALRVAPSQEQQLIVEAIDSYLTRLDDAIASLERVQAKLKAYRASVLKAAVEGRLVPTEASLARAEKRDYEPAGVLLARILKERRRRWEEAELSKQKAAGKAPKDDKWKAKYKGPVGLDTSTLPELPEGWCWASADALFWDADYGTSEKCTPDGTGNAVLRIPNVDAGRISLDDMKYAAKDADLRQDGGVEPSDFLFIRTNGSRSLIGRGALVERRFDPALHFASYLIRLRLVEVEGASRWFALAWHGPSVREQLLKVAASSAGQHNVSLSAASSFAVPLPPPIEQSRILTEVDALTSKAAKMQAQTASDVRRCGRLRQSVLKWAFEGKLVDQDPSDEPADRLVARIWAERAVVAPAKKYRGRTANGAA